MSERYDRALRAVSRAWNAYLSASATASRLRADYAVKPSESRWQRADRAERARETALARWVAARRRADDLAPREPVRCAARIAPRMIPTPREWGSIGAAIAAGVVAAVLPAVAFLGSVVSVETLAAAVR